MNETLNNYAYRKSATINLGLISGPYIWGAEIESVLKNIYTKDFHSYPDLSINDKLKVQLSENENVPESWIYITPGADAAIDIISSNIIRNNHKCIGIVNPTFPRFENSISFCNEIQILNYSSIEKIDNKSDFIYICTPNNPTTVEYSEKELKEKIESYPNCTFCIDAVFDKYGSYDIVDTFMLYDNVIIIKSFSKIGLAGLRLGYIIARPNIINKIKLISSPFLVPNIIKKMGLAVLKRIDKFSEIQRLVDESYQQMRRELGDNLIRESSVPFYLVKTRMESKKAELILLKDGINVIGGHEFKGLSNQLIRVGLGTSNENIKLTKGLIDNNII